MNREDLVDQIRVTTRKIDAELKSMERCKIELERIIKSPSPPGKRAQRRAMEVSTKFKNSKSQLETLTTQLEELRRRMRVLNNSYSNLEESSKDTDSVIIDVRTSRVSSNSHR